MQGGLQGCLAVDSAKGARRRQGAQPGSGVVVGAGVVVGGGGVVGPGVVVGPVVDCSMQVNVICLQAGSRFSISSNPKPKTLISVT